MWKQKLCSDKDVNELLHKVSLLTKGSKTQKIQFETEEMSSATGTLLWLRKSLKYSSKKNQHTFSLPSLKGLSQFRKGI